MDGTDLSEVRRTLWKAADELRANSQPTPSGYRGPVLGLIFLAYAEHRFEAVRTELEGSGRVDVLEGGGGGQPAFSGAGVPGGPAGGAA